MSGAYSQTVMLLARLVILEQQKYIAKNQFSADESMSK